MADIRVPADGPAYCMGGLELDGTPKPFSFVSLPRGRHTLSAVARYADGSEARRSVSFDYQPLFTGAVSWEKDIRPIHVDRCAKCHETSNQGRPLATYGQWKDNAALIVAAVREQRMPADGPLDPQLLTLIQRWVATGSNP